VSRKKTKKGVRGLNARKLIGNYHQPEGIYSLQHKKRMKKKRGIYEGRGRGGGRKASYATGVGQGKKETP